jgi:hypothetical protein
MLVMPSTGISFLNCAAEEAAPDACTIIISGPPRSGTSLIAAMLRASGLWIGELSQNDNQEDTDIAFAIEPQKAWCRLARFVANVDRPTLAARGVDVRILQEKIALRNARFRQWGFKRPNVIIPLRSGGLRLFRSPRVIVTLRDPLALAERILESHPFVPIEDALGIARDMTHANINAFLSLNSPIMLVSYEKAATERDHLLVALCRFCGLTLPPQGYASIAGFVDAAHRQYSLLKEYARCIDNENF